MRSEPFEQGATYDLAFSISMEDQEAFADLSGDFNPIHLNSSYAASKGFSAPVVYGGLLIAKLSQVIGMSVPGPSGLWSNVRMDFRRPLLVGEHASLHVAVSQISEATRSVVMQVTVRTTDKVIATGQAIGTSFPET